MFAETFIQKEVLFYDQWKPDFYLKNVEFL